MRPNSGGFFMLLLVVAAVLLMNTNVDCTATVEKIEEEAAESEGGSESWAEWAKNKFSEGLGFKAAGSKTNQLTKDEAGCGKDKACELKEKAAEAYEKTGEAKDKVAEKVSDMGEESKKREAEAEDTLDWAKEKAKEGCEAAKSKAEEETYESGKDKLSHHQEL